MKKIILCLIAVIIIAGIWISHPQHAGAATWKPEYSGSQSDLNAVFGVASNTIFAVDSLGTVFRYDGTYWNGMVGLSGYFYNDIWASGPQNIYVVGDGGRLIHYNGSSWTPVDTGTESAFYSIWGSSPSDIFAVGWYGTVLHFNGTVWETMTIPNPMASLKCVWGSGPNDVYAVGWEVFHYDGSSWTKILQDYSLDHDFYSVWGSSVNDVFIGSQQGVIFHYDGTSWSQMSTGMDVTIRDMWGTSANNVYAVGDGGVVVRYNGSVWNAVDIGGTDKNLKGIWGSTASDIVVVGEGGAIYHYKNWPVGYTLSLAKTGQTESYYPGDDGDVEAGVEWPDPRFTDNGDGTVTDNLTGLMWMKEANLAQNLSGFIPGAQPDGSITWQDALDFVAAINAGSINTGIPYNDWRLPNVAEIESLFNAAPCSVGMWMMDMGYFENVSGKYWTSTTHKLYTDRAWYAALGDYVWCQNGMYYRDKNSFYHAWYVRGESNGPAPVRKTGQTESYYPGDDGEIQAGKDWPEPRFIDNGDGTVTDRLTGLMWLKDARCFGQLTWNQSLEIVAELNTHPEDFECIEYTRDYDDWRVPNNRELLSLLDYSNQHPALPKEYFRYFPNVAAGGWTGTYWSSTTLNWCDMSVAFTVLFDDGFHVTYDKPVEHWVWPVRTAPRFTIVKPYPDFKIFREWPFDIVGRILTIDATQSYSADPLNPIVSYQWDLNGDGVYDDASGPVVDCFWETAGTYTVSLKITDSTGAIAVKSISLTIAEAEPLEVKLYIKQRPSKHKHPLHKKSKGVFLAVIVGSDDVDVKTIDPDSLALQGVKPLKIELKGVGKKVKGGKKAKGNKKKYPGKSKGKPAYLIMKFSTEEIMNALTPAPEGLLEKGNTVTLTLTGKLKAENGGTPIRGFGTSTMR